MKVVVYLTMTFFFFKIPFKNLRTNIMFQDYSNMVVILLLIIESELIISNKI